MGQDIYIKESKMTKKEKILFQVELLEDFAYNNEGEIIDVVFVDQIGNIYYYDGTDRYCYLGWEERGISWKKKGDRYGKTNSGIQKHVIIIKTGLAHTNRSR